MDEELERLLTAVREQLPLLATIYGEFMTKLTEKGFTREEAIELLKLHKVGN